jgi:hypothetical protein
VVHRDDGAGGVEGEGPRGSFGEERVVVVALGRDSRPGLAEPGEEWPHELAVGAYDGGAGAEGGDEAAEVAAGAVGQQFDQRFDGKVESIGERFDRLPAAQRGAGQNAVDRYIGELLGQGLGLTDPGVVEGPVEVRSEPLLFVPRACVPD